MTATANEFVPFKVRHKNGGPSFTVIGRSFTSYRVRDHGVEYVLPDTEYVEYNEPQDVTNELYVSTSGAGKRGVFHLGQMIAQFCCDGTYKVEFNPFRVLKQS